MIQILSCSSELGNCCNDAGVALILDAFRKAVVLLQILVPILLIIFASIEFFKLMMNPDKKGGYKPIINKFIAAAVVFLVPFVIDTFLNMMPQSFSVTACWNQVKTTAETVRSTGHKYIPPHSTDAKPATVVPDPKDYQKGVPKPGDGAGGLAPASARGILEGAEKVHTIYETQGWYYYTKLSQLKWNDINYSTNNPSKATCCATFVGSALYVGGVFTEAELNSVNYNLASDISYLCQKHGWTKITSYSQLAAGDIVVMTSGGGSGIGHVQIYAGNGTWYNAGSTDAIKRDSPYSGDASSRFLWAWRKTS